MSTDTSRGDTPQESNSYKLSKPSSIAVLCYYVVYIIYLYYCIEFENEWFHWITLVILPTAIALHINLKSGSPLAMSNFLSAIGLSRRRLPRGLRFAIICGALLGILQVALSRNRDQIIELIFSGEFIIYWPPAIALMLITAGFTEEFFFRGLMQNASYSLVPSRALAIIVSAVLFGVYHFPYAYLKTSWPSHGNLAQSISEGVVPSIVIGLIFAFAYDREKNLIVPIVMHAMFNSVWAMTIFAR